MRKMISIKGLSKKYEEYLAVDDINFDVFEGEIFGLLGPNGAGKTTTLEILETLRKKTSGNIIIDDIDIDKQPLSIKQIIGVQLQQSGYYLNLNLKENIQLFAGLYNVKNFNAQELLKLVGLEEHAHKKFKQLSGGQQQRFSLAILLVNDPKIIFLDEPTTGLDPHARRNIWNIILELKRKGKTIVLTTHYMDEAELLCDRIAIMNAGKIITIDTPENLIENILNAGFEPRKNIKPANLEDVFLFYTGHQLIQ